MSKGVEGRIHPHEKTMVFAEVIRNVAVSPSFRRITISSAALRDFTPLGFDQWFRLFLPLPGHEDMRLPKDLSLLSYVRFLTIPKPERPMLRNYTVRAYRAGEAGADPELDIDFVVHGDEGFASAWAQDAAPGSRVAILDEGILFVPPADTRQHLIVSDETGLPAIASILESMGAAAAGDIVLEVPHADDLALLAVPPMMRLHGLVRGHGEKVGARAMERVRQLAFEPNGLYAFAIGESGIATGTRRYLVSERHVPKQQVTFCGFWREGHSGR